MKQTLKFILSIGSAKMVVLSNGTNSTYYANTNLAPLNKIPNLEKIACLITER
mgnify:CR=1 FL=1